MNIIKITFYPSKKVVTVSDAAKCGPTDDKNKCKYRYGDPKWKDECKALLKINTAQVGYDNNMELDMYQDYEGVIEDDFDQGNVAMIGYHHGHRHHKSVIDNDPKILLFTMSMMISLCVCCLCGIGIGLICGILFMKVWKIIPKKITRNQRFYEQDKEIP